MQRAEAKAKAAVEFKKGINRIQKENQQTNKNKETFENNPTKRESPQKAPKQQRHGGRSEKHMNIHLRISDSNELFQVLHKQKHTPQRLAQANRILWAPFFRAQTRQP